MRVPNGKDALLSAFAPSKQMATEFGPPPPVMKRMKVLDNSASGLDDRPLSSAAVSTLSPSHLQAVIVAQRPSMTVRKSQRNDRTKRLVSLLEEVRDDGAMALKVAKRCELLPLPDSLVYFSESTRFYAALSQDVNAASLIQTVADALEQTKEDQFRVFLKRFSLESVKASGALLSVKNVPSSLIESSLEVHLKAQEEEFSESDIGILQKMVDIVTPEVCIESILRLLQDQHPQFTVTKRVNDFIQKALLTEEVERRRMSVLNMLKERVVEDCCHAEQALSLIPAAAALRLAQTLCESEQTVYETWLNEGVLRLIQSGSHFRRIIQAMEMLLPTEQEWTLNVHRKGLNLHPMRQMKCRAGYFEAIKDRKNKSAAEEERLVCDGDKNEDTAAQKEANEILAVWQSSSSSSTIPATAKLLRLQRPKFFQVRVWPLLVASATLANVDPETLAKRAMLIQVMKREWSLIPTKPVVTDGCVSTDEQRTGATTSFEMVQRILPLLEPDRLNRIDAMTSDEFTWYFDAIRKNIVTFCAIAESPSMVLAKAALVVFQRASLVDTISSRLIALQRLLLVDSDLGLLGRLLVDLLGDELLFFLSSDVTRRKQCVLIRHLVHCSMTGTCTTPNTMIESLLFDRLAMKAGSALIGGLDLSLKVLSLYTEWYRVIRSSQPEREPKSLPPVLSTMTWLRCRIEGCLLDPLQTTTRPSELDDFDGVLYSSSSSSGPIYQFFSTPLEFFAKELAASSSSSSSMRRAVFIVQMCRERFDARVTLEAGIRACLEFPLGNDDSPSADVLLSLTMIMRYVNLAPEEILYMFAETWKQIVAGGIPGITTIDEEMQRKRWLRFLHSALESHQILFGPQQALRHHQSKKQAEVEFGLLKAMSKNGRLPECITLLLPRVFNWSE